VSFSRGRRKTCVDRRSGLIPLGGGIIIVRAFLPGPLRAGHSIQLTSCNHFHDPIGQRLLKSIPYQHFLGGLLGLIERDRHVVRKCGRNHSPLLYVTASTTVQYLDVWLCITRLCEFWTVGVYHNVCLGPKSFYRQILCLLALFVRGQ